jgi:diphthamide biosynthesis enzyme Dph1/Dph2-like protein
MFIDRYLIKSKEEVWPPKELDVLFLGDEDSFVLLSYVLAFPPASLWLYNVGSGTISKGSKITPSRESWLRRRFPLLVKAQSAQTFGIIVNNPTIATWKDVQLSVKQLLKAHGKKFYDLVMSKSLCCMISLNISQGH